MPATGRTRAPETYGFSTGLTSIACPYACADQRLAPGAEAPSCSAVAGDTCTAKGGAMRSAARNAGTILPVSVVAAVVAALACAAPVSSTGASTELVTVTAASRATTFATVRLWEQRDGCWRAA